MQKIRRPLKQRIFGLDNKLMRTSARIFDLMLLNFLFVLSCLPIITIGPAIIALYRMVAELGQGKVDSLSKDYYYQLKENFKQGLFLGILGSFVFSALLINLKIFMAIELPIGIMLQMLCYGIGFISLIIGLYSFQISGKYETTIPQLLKNAFYLSFLNFSKTLLLVAIILPIGVLLGYSPVSMLLTVSILLFIGFSMIASLQTVILQPVFEKYSNEN